MSPARRIEIFLAGCLYYSGLVSLSRRWTQRSGPTLTILCYHSMSDGYLREQLLYLRRCYRVLHLDEALEELYELRAQDSPQRDPRPLLTLTFDDGYRDLYTYGLPLVTELQTPVTSFVVPGYLESGERFWWLEPDYLLLHTPLQQVLFQGKTYQLDDQEQRQLLWQAVDTGLRYASSLEEREQFATSARSAFQLPTSIEESEQEKALLPLNWDEVCSMEQSPWISFEAHTMHHPVLAYLKDETELFYEVGACRSILEERLKHPVRSFAYPVGKNEHIEEKGVKAVKKAEYTWAVTTLHGLNTAQTDPHFLYRIVVDVDQHWLMVAAKSSGLWDRLVQMGRFPVTLLRNVLK